MNFNPNSYMGYSYTQNMNPYMQPQQQQMQQNFISPQQPQVPSLNGKIVESKDIVKITEVPMGGYGIFPKADLTEIYVKTWDSNTKQMNTLTYKLENEAELPPIISDSSSKLLERFNELEQKFDNVIAAFSTIGEKSTTNTEKATTAAQSKEVKKNAF